MEGLTVGEIVTGVAVVVGNVVTLKWLRVEQNKQAKDITLLFEKVDKTMTKQDIKELVTECVGSLKEENAKMAIAMEKIADSVAETQKDFIRIDERYKNHISQSQRRDDT